VYEAFDLEMPAKLEDALRVLSDGKGGTPLAGGTNLIVDMRAGRERPERIVALGNIGELRGISTGDGRTIIGSMTTVSDLLRAPEIARGAPSLVEAATLFAGQMVRNTATLGGNIACGSPAADLVPPLMSLDAEITLAGASGMRTLPLADFFRGYKQDVREAGELIFNIAWNPLPTESVNTFYKLARRRGDAITVTGLAVTLCVAEGRCARARIALGAVSPTVVRAKRAEAMLEGQVLDAKLIDASAAQAARECSPIDDIRASAEYRQHAVRVLTRRLVSNAWDTLV